MRALKAHPIDRERNATPTSLYVHIPFCKSRCFYCDFNTYVAPERVMENYVESLDREFSLLGANATSPLETVFFGGGTPTLPPPALLERMLESMHAHFRFAPEAEVTFESNPDSVDDDKLKLLKDHGVTRLSFGAQTFQDRLLLTIGRSHDAQTVVERVEAAAKLGFRHINVDLMFGLPEQSLDDVDDALARVLSLPIDHVSAYWLKIEEGTPFAKWRDKGQLPLPGEDLEGDMYDKVRERLISAGLRHYEISNFAKSGGEARHNLVYWRNQPYLAAGAGAHGYVNGTRYENVRRIPAYMEKLTQAKRPIDEEHTVSHMEAAEDAMMLGLRLDEGVSQKAFEARFGVKIHDLYGELVTDLERDGLVEVDGDRIRIPSRYWPVANVIFEKFVTANPVD
ncbi:radical SAM family heme chaperone HemW [Alicyclobacillus dauci]|uniref:Heme chaperone HemW n=1 Tax=Alicyclobacillus dauci TaxID=1475485 RepID=A0ABY6Z8F4_9BACL|nr:radical SAM family heme chaperone HemW [Alicyclobacillus dauci]WAH38534.1 radical SAM family heme chaperone HemW [Alicyclobacillus dauci]